MAKQKKGFSVRNYFIGKISRFLYSTLQFYFRSRYAFDIKTQLRIRALNTTCAYIEQHMVEVPLFQSYLDATSFALEKVVLDGAYLEFGVYKGDSVNFIARKINGKPIHAFDSFEGLPEDWLWTHKAGHFAVEKMPRFEKNVVVQKGWFNETIPGYKQSNNQNIAFLHVDCDLYSSTKTIFDMLGDRIVENTIIIFDEYFNYPFWEHHEYKAFQEFVKANNIKYQYLCYSSNDFGAKVAVKILKKG